VFQDTSLLGRIVYALAKWTAVAGGVVMIATVIMVVASIGGRALIWAGLRPITGDYELVSAGMGFAVFAFMPWAHLMRGHALVALVTDNFGARANRLILVITDLMMLMASGFIAWRLYFGTMDKFAYGETTLLLRMPLGWAYAAGLVGAVIWVIIAVYVLGRSITNLASGRTEAPSAGAHT
jgi:TRAP-type C4-dicarboxylate transport system permease small subunit